MKTVTLGNLEKDVMDIIWEMKSCSARGVLTVLQKDRKLAYTTVATILQRLYDKGLVARKNDKSGYIYTPKITKQLYSKNIAQSFLKKFIDSFGNTALASFVESIDKLPAKKREYFIKLLDAHDKGK